MSKDRLGSRIKDEFEAPECGRRFETGKPVIIRLDGRAFHRFTRPMERPFDDRLLRTMYATTSALVRETGALIGYTQSDEITLVLYSDRPENQIFFDGKVHKLVSVTASLCTAHFNQNITKEFEGSGLELPLATFDSRAFQVPTKEAALAILHWREVDARRNSLNMLARSHFSHKTLLNQPASVVIGMLAEKGVVWDDLPARYRSGMFLQRRKKDLVLPEEERLRIPVGFRPAPGEPVTRTVVEPIHDLQNIRSVPNILDVIFGEADPEKAVHHVRSV